MTASRLLGNLLIAMGLFVGATCVTGSLAGCQQSLFADSDAATKHRIDTYYGGDSARETTESRRKSGTMGFGMPTGGGFQ